MNLKCLNAGEECVLTSVGDLLVTEGNESLHYMAIITETLLNLEEKKKKQMAINMGITLESLS